jgi:DNA replication protein DnaC
VWNSGETHVLYQFPVLIRKLIGEESDETLQECIDADVLWLDDVGAAYLKPDGLGEALFEEIVVTREANGCQVVMTTNLTIPRFEAAFGDRIADRLRGEWGVWRALPGQSFRRKPRPSARATS